MKGRTLKIASVALASVLVVTVAMAQAKSVAAQVFHLQLERFVGSYVLEKGGTLAVQSLGEGATWSLDSTVDGKPFQVQATSNLDNATGRQKVKLMVGGKAYDGFANVSGKDLTVDAKSNGETYRLRLRLSGRSEGDVQLTRVSDGGDEKILLSAGAKRAQ